MRTSAYTVTRYRVTGDKRRILLTQYVYERDELAGSRWDGADLRRADRGLSVSHVDAAEGERFVTVLRRSVCGDYETA